MSKEAIEQIPLASLGFGIVAYIDILWTLIIFFGLASLLVYPALTSFNNGVGYAGNVEALSSYETGMLGNLGYSSTICTTAPTELDQINIACNYG